jgi:hypothetical protein
VKQVARALQKILEEATAAEGLVDPLTVLLVADFVAVIPNLHDVIR